MSKKNRRKGGRQKLRTTVQLTPGPRMARGTEPPPNLEPLQASAPAPQPTGAPVPGGFSSAALRTEVTLQSDSNFYTGFTDDIGEGGVFVATEDLYPVGTSLQLEFSLPDEGGAISVEGEVRWIRKLIDRGDEDAASGVGVAFRELTPEARKRIESFLSQRDTLFFD